VVSGGSWWGRATMSGNVPPRAGEKGSPERPIPPPGSYPSRFQPMPDAPAAHPPGAPLRVAAVSDVHYGRHAAGSHRDLFRAMAEAADVLLLCGDLTDYGLPEEAELLAEDLRAASGVPVLAVLGNHDYESGRPED